jgi:ElaB/YqjD/DUF883 family membrane-anchored ribosome-binding protein
MDRTDFARAARGVGSRIERAAASVTDSGERAYDQATEAVRSAASQAGEYGSQALDRVEDAGDYIGAEVERHPLVAILIAFGVGFVLAWLIKPAQKRTA